MSRKRRPLQWLREADPGEIAEALLAVDPIKALQVSTYLARRISAEAEQTAKIVGKQLEDDPVRTVGRALLGGIKGVMGQ